MPVTEIIDDTREFLDLKAEIKALKAEIKSLKTEIGRAQARSEVAVVALAGGANPDTLVDLMGRVDSAGWAMNDGRLVQIDANGTMRTTVGPEEWVKELRGKAKHLFVPHDAPVQYAPGTGSGSQNGGGQSISTGRDNPWTKEGWDDMAQAAAYRSNPDRAEAMAKAAGSRIGALRPA